MTARTYWTLWLLQTAVVVLLLFILTVPIQDYSISEFKDYVRHPSPQTLQAFRDKKEAELRLRREIALPLAVLTVVLAIFTFRKPARETSQ